LWCCILSFGAYFKDGAILETAELDAAHQGSLDKAMDKFRAMIKGDSHAPYEKKFMVRVCRRLLGACLLLCLTHPFGFLILNRAK